MKMAKERTAKPKRNKTVKGVDSSGIDFVNVRFRKKNHLGPIFILTFWTNFP
jgi:hypothetical protein